MIVDTHCHLDKEYYENLDEIISEMNNNIIVASSVDLETTRHVVKLCDKYENIYGTIGFHPSELENYNEANLKELESYLRNPKIVGIGEIGLDYHYGNDNKDQQIKAFKEQILLAKKYNKTIVIHSRDAALDTYNILKEMEIKNNKVILHCYSYSLEMAKEFKKLNIKFGIGGVLTFKNSQKLKEVVEYLDLEDILLETDSPYLTPEPFRGKINRPINVNIVASKIAQLKNISEEEVKKVTTSNAISQFDLKI